LRSLRAPEWFSIEKARRAQSLLAKRVITKDMLPEDIKYVGGADIAYAGDKALAAAVVMDFDTMELVDHAIYKCRVIFPYVPTLLSFREAWPVSQAILSLKVKPDVVLIDGQGLAHPYRLGLASHVGVVLDIPTIGVAKKKLCGIIGKYKDHWAPIMDRGEVIGAALITRKGANPIFVSIGHKVSLERAIEIVLKSCRGHKLPEPIRAAHNMATRAARRGIWHQSS